MREVWIRQRNQLTVPGDIAEAAGIGPGSMCRMDIVNGVITLTPADQGAPDVARYRGVGSGAWGSSIAEINETIGRDTWDR